MLSERRALPLGWRLRNQLIRLLLPYPKRLAFAFGALRFYQRSPIRRLVGWARDRRLGPRRLIEAEAMLPELPDRSWRPPAERQAAGRRRVALLTGCVMPHLYPRTHAATVGCLDVNGVDVTAPAGQVCCGALNLHSGDIRTARQLARKNIDVFLGAEVDAVVVNSAGCGSTMKEYDYLLRGDAAYADRARRFAGIVQDVTEFLVSAGFRQPARGLSGRVTYQDSCHLAHAQRIRSAPREILRSIKGLELIEMKTPDRCCGSAGIYSFAQPQMSMRILDEKISDVAATRSEIIATANPGCMMQLEAGLRRAGRSGRVVHVVELLDEAYQRET
jgi:glycolate oxidase iron-sulfur subunit